mmetsp:Transcript_75654/g.197272  ORF Transcript_75654/g.197272 Transcript_75654/m.197272 type:complete len:224 (+) Transcript_75654:1364-2035(+)
MGVSRFSCTNASRASRSATFRSCTGLSSLISDIRCLVSSRRLVSTWSSSWSLSAGPSIVSFTLLSADCCAERHACSSLPAQAEITSVGAHRLASAASASRIANLRDCSAARARYTSSTSASVSEESGGSKRLAFAAASCSRRNLPSTSSSTMSSASVSARRSSSSVVVYCQSSGSRSFRLLSPLLTKSSSAPASRALMTAAFSWASGSAGCSTAALRASTVLS